MDLFNQIRKKLVIFVHFKGFNISQKPKSSSLSQTCLPQLTLKSSICSSSAYFGNAESSFRKLKTMVSDSWAGAIMAYTHSIYIPNIYLSYMYLLKMGARVAQWVRSYSTERDIPWSRSCLGEWWGLKF